MARRKLVQSLQPKISLAQSFPYVYKREIFSHRTTSIDWENFFSQEKFITFSQWNGKGGRRSSHSLSIPERNKEKAMVLCRFWQALQDTKQGDIWFRTSKAGNDSCGIGNEIVCVGYCPVEAHFKDDGRKLNWFFDSSDSCSLPSQCWCTLNVE